MRAASAAAFDAGISPASDNSSRSTSSGAAAFCRYGRRDANDDLALRRRNLAVVRGKRVERAAAQFLEMLGQLARHRGTTLASE